MQLVVSSEDTLDNLVAQFARPMDCLRELVQNAMDAGTPRVDVWLAYRDGVLEIHVDDAGSGMDEAIIDKQLTRLFSSTKEGDRTKIGKFGIGFSSIFAIQPDAVLLRTGRHGQNWELVFHPDRSFDKASIDEPVQGTQITLFKRMGPADVAARVAEARDVLAYWCEHAHTPITFADRTSGEASEPEAVDASDPFAAFAGTPSEPAVESISGPLALDAVVEVGIDVEGIEALVGVGRDGPGPYGFYNGGLTLVSSKAPEVLGAFPQLAHLTFKVRCDQLEHTLTRDNVLQDETFRRVLQQVDRARSRLVEAAVEALAKGADRDPLMAFLVAEHRVLRAPPCPAGRIPLADHDGQAWSLAEVLAQGARYGAVLVEGPVDADLDLALRAQSIRRLPDADWVGPVAREWSKAGLLLSGWALPVRRPREVFVQPDYQEPSGEMEAALLDAATRLLAGAAGHRMALRLGAFDEGLSDPELVVAGPRFGDLFLRRTPLWSRLPEWLGWRHLVLNTVHPFYRSQLLAAERDPVLAAQGLLLALLHGEESDHVLVRLAHAALVEVRR